MEENGRGDGLCKVCGDKASGKHYGVSSCDGCRGFFKRSIRRNLDYVCKENGQCIVDVSRRNQCQACRFTKCLQVNMQKHAVQHERAPRSVQTSPGATTASSTLFAMAAAAATTRKVSQQQQQPPPPSLQSCAALYPAASHVYHGAAAVASAAPYHPLLYPALFSFKPSAGVPSFASSPAAHFVPRPAVVEPLQQQQQPLPTSSVGGKEDEVTSSEEAAANDRLHFKKISDDRVMSTRLTNPLICTSFSDGHAANFSLLPTENINELAAKLLFLAVKWPRSISSFLQLSYRDQAILLEESWFELFVLTAAQWNFPVEESQLIPATTPAYKRQILSDEARRLRELLTRCAILQIDHSEYACLKAIVLFKGESRGLSDAARVTASQEQTVSVLSDRGGRVGQLLLLLPPIRALCRHTLQELLFKQTIGEADFERLLGDVVHMPRPH
ncbi:hypothetical protein TKK_0014033 [Trichogramma kaykai]